MSNKKFRRPANRGFVSAALAGGGTAPASEAEPGMAPTHTSASGGLRVPQYDLNVTDDEAMGFLNEMTRFLAGIVRTGNRILASIHVADVREMVAPDMAPADTPPDETMNGEQDPEGERIRENIKAAHKKLPRSHPLMGLIRYTLAAARLLERLLQATKPHLFGRESLQYRHIKRAVRASEKFLEGEAPGELMEQAIKDTGLQIG